MSKFFVTSDQHFNHENIIKYCDRPFSSVEEMNEKMIKRWNAVVSKDDTVFVLGDFFMGRLTEIEDILSRLNGHIMLVEGNHDKDNRITTMTSCGNVKNLGPLCIVDYRSINIVMCHYPIDFDLRGMVSKTSKKMVFLYGHIHNLAPKGLDRGCFYHVGVDTNNFTPVDLDSIIDEVLKYE